MTFKIIQMVDEFQLPVKFGTVKIEIQKVMLTGQLSDIFVDLKYLN